MIVGLKGLKAKEKGRQLEGYFLCSWYDYLEISNDKHERFGEYCGELSGNAVIVTGNYTVITFESDGRREARGFLIHFTAAPRKYSEVQMLSAMSQYG